MTTNGTGASAVLLLANAFLVSRLEQSAWPRFFVIFWWALLAYVISAGMIGFAFHPRPHPGRAAGPWCWPCW